MTGLEWFYAASVDDAIASLLACCGSRAWARQVAGLRDTALDHRDQAATIMGHPGVLIDLGSRVWFGLPEADWLEAFACHPRIGEARAPAHKPPAGFLACSSDEQRAAQETLAGVAGKLLEGNRAYEAKFGFLYLVFASGRTASELLTVLERRLSNTRVEELQEAARQQDRITRLRMERWLA